MFRFVMNSWVVYDDIYSIPMLVMLVVLYLVPRILKMWVVMVWQVSGGDPCACGDPWPLQIYAFGKLDWWFLCCFNLIWYDVVQLGKIASPTSIRCTNYWFCRIQAFCSDCCNSSYKYGSFGKCNAAISSAKGQGLEMEHRQLWLHVIFNTPSFETIVTGTKMKFEMFILFLSQEMFQHLCPSVGKYLLNEFCLFSS